MRPTLLLITAMLVVPSCRADRTLSCETNTDCIRHEVQGECLLPGFCAFGDGECTTGRRWDSSAGEGLDGKCVVFGDGGTGQLNACGGLTVLDGPPGNPCGLCNSGTWSCDGVDAVLCTGELANEELLVAESASASSTYEGNFPEYGPSRATDDMVETSWFSTGENDTTFTWGGENEVCIKQVEFIGNGAHSNTEFRTGFGFTNVTINVKNDLGQTTFTRLLELPGTPDPDSVIEVGAIGINVELEFGVPEDAGVCGGFAELKVTAATP